jgi:hypothetical protein
VWVQKEELSKNKRIEAATEEIKNKTDYRQGAHKQMREIESGASKAETVLERQRTDLNFCQPRIWRTTS